MKYLPKDKSLSKHIDHYWIVNDAEELFMNSAPFYAYPGITPELIIVLEGSLSYFYENKNNVLFSNKLFSFIKEEVIIDTRNLKSFIIVQFKPRALSSILPFVNHTSYDLITNPVSDGQEIFGDQIDKLNQHVSKLDSQSIVNELDHFFSSNLNAEKEGFISEMAIEMENTSNLKSLLNKTNYSYSTLDRYFKKDTGLSPKQFHTLRRYKLAVQEIYNSRNSNWIHYVNKYGYFDQSHFIKDIKRHTSFTPSQLLQTKGLLNFRP